MDVKAQVKAYRLDQFQKLMEMDGISNE